MTEYCFSQEHAQQRYNSRPAEYKQAIRKAITYEDNDQVCFDTDHEGWQEAKDVAEQNTGSSAKNFVKNAAKGAKSVAKTSLGVDRLSDQQIEKRLDVCRKCPHAVWKKDQSDVNTCGPMLESMKAQGQKTCGCILNKKAKDAKEECPYGYWKEEGV